MIPNKQLFIIKLTFLIIFIAFSGVVTNGQTPTTAKKPASKIAGSTNDAVRASSAYAEVLLRKTEVEAELEALLIDYTDDFPKVGELKYELGRLNAAADMLLAVKAADKDRLTLALGKLLVKRADAETALNEISKTYKEGHPDFKRAKRRVEIYDNAVQEIMGGGK